MNYEGMYNKLIVERNSTISNSAKVKSNLIGALRLLEAELKLYTECYAKNGLTKYENLKFETERKCTEKQSEIDELENTLNDINQEIIVLEELIKSE